MPRPPEAARWRPAGFTALARGGSAGTRPPFERWEELLRAEQSPAYRLARAASGSALLARLLKLPSPPGPDDWPTLEQREELVQSLRRSRLRSLFRPSSPPAADRRQGGERPAPGPLLDREINAALAVLADVPFEEVQERGWHLQPRHFYWPLNDLGYLRDHPELWRRRRPLEGIELDVGGQLTLSRRLAAHAGELSDVGPGPAARPGEFVWDNATFSALDAYLYYGVVRELRPRRVVEVGAGWSSLVLARAAAANGGDVEVTLIEPYPDPSILGELPSGWRMIESLVQEAPLTVFEALEAGDVLFYDGSHCVHTGSDVNWMFFDVLPRLARGVWIHLHDIAWPGDYPAEWILDEGLSWNEQYLLEAFLTGNSGYRVRLGSAQLLAEESETIRRHFPGALQGGSVWLEKTSP